MKLIDLPQELLRIPAQNLAEAHLNKLLATSDEDTVSKVLEINSNRQVDFPRARERALESSLVTGLQRRAEDDSRAELHR